MKKTGATKKILAVTLLLMLLGAEGYSQAAKPRIMVFPAEIWMKANNFYTDRKSTRLNSSHT